MEAKLRQKLSPAALATVLALSVMPSAVAVPWFIASPAEANHCAPPCDCACVCDCACACNCDCAGCPYTDDDDRGRCRP
jgi:hypothetical protein